MLDGIGAGGGVDGVSTSDDGGGVCVWMAMAGKDLVAANVAVFSLCLAGIWKAPPTRQIRFSKNDT